MESFYEIEKFEVRGQIQKVVINKLQAKQKIQVMPENQNTVSIQGNEQEQTPPFFSTCKLDLSILIFVFHFIELVLFCHVKYSGRIVFCSFLL
jgi:hypothetical protein